MIGYGFIILVFTCLSYLPPYTHHIATAQNPDATIENCLVEFHYPIEWQNFVYDSSNCEENYTEITIPQPSLSEKIPSQITILVEPCCPFKDAEGFTTKNMSLEEYANQQVNTYSQYFLQLTLTIFLLMESKHLK